jgi:hypothetical protein
MELCEGGDLASVIRKAKKEAASLEERFVWKVRRRDGRAGCSNNHQWRTCRCVKELGTRKIEFRGRNLGDTCACMLY